MDLGVINLIIDKDSLYKPQNLLMPDIIGSGIIMEQWVGEINVLCKELPMNISIIGTSNQLRVEVQVRVIDNGKTSSNVYGDLVSFSRNSTVSEIAGTWEKNSNTVSALFVVISLLLSNGALNQIKNNGFFYIFSEGDNNVGIAPLSEIGAVEIAYVNRDNNSIENRCFPENAIPSSGSFKSTSTQKTKSYKTQDTIRSLTQDAKNGDSYAMQQLAMAYFNGDGINQDFEKSFYWWDKLSETGDSVAAFFNLGLMYAKGCGIAQDFDKAAEYMKIAMDKGDEDAPEAYGHFKDANRNIANAEKGDAEAQAKCAELYLYLGRSLSQAGTETEDFAEAFKYAKMSADQENADGLFDLGLCYYNGRHVETDYSKAAELYNKAAEMGHAEAMSNLASCYLGGEGVEENENKAYELLEKAAKKGHKPAIEALKEKKKAEERAKIEEAEKKRKEKEKNIYDSVSQKIEAYNKWKTDSKNLREKKRKKAKEKLQALFDDATNTLIVDRDEKIKSVNEKIRLNEAQRRDKEIKVIGKSVPKKERAELEKIIPELKEAVSLLEKEKSEIISNTMAEAKVKIDLLSDDVKKISGEIEAEFKSLPEPELPTHEEFRIYTERLPYEKNEKRKTKTELHNEQIMEDILDGMAIGEEYTVPELIEYNSSIDMYSNQKISALVARLVKKGQVKRRTAGGKTYFSLVEGYSEIAPYEKTFEKPEKESIDVSAIWNAIVTEGLKKFSGNSIDSFDRNRKKAEEEHQNEIKKIESRLKKKKNTHKALIILGCVAAGIIAIICLVNYMNGAPEREVADKIKSGTYTSEWAKNNNYVYMVSYRESIIKTSADKLTELHKNNKPKEALMLSSELIETGLKIGGDSYLHPTDEFINWLKDSIKTEGTIMSSSDDSYCYSAYGFTISWNSRAVYNQFSILEREGEDYFTEQDISTYYYTVSSSELIIIN